MTRRDRFGLPLSTTTDDAVVAYVDGIDCLLSGNVGAEIQLRRAVELDEGFALAHAALASFEQRARQPDAARKHATIAQERAGGTTRREQSHVTTLTAGILGESSAFERTEQHLTEHPGDGYMLAQYVMLRRGLGDRRYNAAILDRLERLESAYGSEWYYAGTRSFYLHELNRFEESRHYAEVSLTGFPRNGNASHNLAHCFYETADYAGGLAFLNDWIVELDPEAPHFPHLNWHRALFELTQGRYERSFAIYQESIRPGVLRHDMRGIGPPLADAASLLWRYRLYGWETESLAQWHDVESFAADVTAGPRFAFADAHAALAFAATGNSQAMDRLIDSLRSAAAAGDALSGEVALPIALGIEAFARGAWDEAVLHLGALGDDMVRVGGSQAQRQVFEDTLLRASMLAGRWDAAEAQLRRRLEHRHSARDFFWLADARSQAGDRQTADEATQQARKLWSDAEPGAPELSGYGASDAPVD